MAEGSFKAATDRLDKILIARGLAARLSVGADSLVVGHRSNAADCVELIFRSRHVFERLMTHLRLLDLAAAYADGTMEVRGPTSSAVDVFDAINAATDRRQTLFEYLRLLAFRISKAILPSASLQFESLDHYSQSAQAYELFLDDYMQYTCGRFQTGIEDIDTAQVAKFELIAELATKHGVALSGATHLDVGCGWGGLAAYFTKHYDTVSLGNTNCLPQMKYARKRFGCDVLFGDFSKLRKLDRRFRLITVVGMIEHLTPYRRAQLMKIVHDLLADDGVAYIQCIAKPTVWIGGDAYRVVEREIFQGHWLEYREQTERLFDKSGFVVMDAFDHATDYGHTTARWAQRIEANREHLVALLGEREYRLYLGYLAYASKLFFTGRGSLMRYVLKKR
jgi:cyclopropane fatty-acyl-phospholipid synthase-like methyltransferase